MIKKIAIVIMLAVASFGMGGAIAVATSSNAASNYWTHWCATHPNRSGKLYQEHCVPTTTTTTSTSTTTTTTQPQNTAYVVSCVPDIDPAQVSLYPANQNLYPHVYDGTPAGAQAFVDSNQGQCWQIYYTPGIPAQ